MPRAGACGPCWSSGTTSRTARAAGARSSSTAACATSPRDRSASPTRAPPSGTCCSPASRRTSRGPLAQVSRCTRRDTCRRAPYIGAGYGLGRRPAPVRRHAGRGAARSGPDRRRRDAAPRARASARDDLRGGMRGWDGQLIDDARLVVAVARTAAGYGASVLTRVEAVAATGDVGATARHAHRRGARRARACRRERDRRVGGRARPRRAAAAEPRHAPRGRRRRGSADRTSRSRSRCPGRRAGSSSRCRRQHGRTYIGLTDVPADGPIPDVPHATEAEIDMLLDVGRARCSPSR